MPWQEIKNRRGNATMKHLRNFQFPSILLAGPPLWRRNLFGELKVAQLAEKFPAFYETRRIVPIFM
jgi:hypothetical protein